VLSLAPGNLHAQAAPAPDPQAAPAPQAPQAAQSAPAQAAPAPSRIHELINLEFASEYLTPRGMLVHDQGLTFEPLLLTLVNFYHGDSFINSVGAVGGCWNDFSTAPVSVHAPFGSKPKTPWTEIDPIGGITLGFAKNFELDVTYTAFAEQILDIGVSQHLETKLTYDDSAYLKAFALHPTFIYWQELQGKATDADVPEAVFGPSAKSGSHPAPGSSYYFDFGVAPSYTFKDGIKLEAPCRVLFPDERFYGNYYAPSSTVGLWEIGIKGTIPMNFMPAGYGHWSFHLGTKFVYFVDDNLYNLNEFNAPGKPTRDTVLGYAGVSIFF
jgi:hypothetical protein